MQLQGTIKYIGKPTTRTGSNGKEYTSLKVLLSVLEGNYTNVYPIDIAPKLQDSADQWSTGQNVTVHINMRGNEYVNKTTGEPDAFLSFSAWKIETGSYVTPANQAIQEAVQDDSHDPLPF